MGIVFYAVAMKRFRETSPGMVGYLILGDKSHLTAAELEAVEDCSPIIDCEVDLVEHELYQENHKN